MYAILFEDDEKFGSMRQKHMQAHLAFLLSNADLVSAAGPLNQLDGESAGGMWLVDTEDEQLVHSLIESDPFWPTGLRKSIRILKWNQVFASGEVLVSPP